MTAYATEAELELDEELLVELTDSTAAPGVVDSAKVAKALADATEAEIDPRLAGTYVVPVPNPPRVLRVWCARIARYLLFRRRPKMAMPDLVKVEFDQVIAELTKIQARAKDAAQLPIDRVVDSEAAEVAAPLHGEARRLFGRARDGLG